jgi:carboxyl-terminal processing protease
MNREKFAWSASIVLLVLLTFQIPNSLAQRDDDYAFVRTLLDVRRQVADNFVGAVDETKLHDGAIAGMLETLDDPYSTYFPPAEQGAFDRYLAGTFRGVGIELQQHTNGEIEIVTPIEGSPAAMAGVQAGDVLTGVDGKPIGKAKVDDLVKQITGPLGSEVSITVRHMDKSEQTYKLIRQDVHRSSVLGYRRLPNNRWSYWVSDKPKIGYVQLTQFTPDAYDDLRAVLKSLLADGMKGFVLDLRFDGGGELDQAERIINMLVPQGRTIVTIRGRARPEQRAVSDGKDTLQNFPMVVLVNGESASASEIVSGSLQDNKRAVIVGTRSFGKGSVQEVLPLDEHSGELKLTVAYYYLPSGRLVHRKPDSTDWGVNPQIVVPMDTATEGKLKQDMDRRDLINRPAATMPATTQSEEPFVDTQLQAGVTTLVGVLAFESQPGPTTGP